MDGGRHRPAAVDGVNRSGLEERNRHRRPEAAPLRGGFMTDLSSGCPAPVSRRSAKWSKRGRAGFTSSKPWCTAAHWTLPADGSGQSVIEFESQARQSMNSLTVSTVDHDSSQVARLGVPASAVAAVDVVWPIRDDHPKSLAEAVRRAGRINLAALDFQSIRLVAFCAELGGLAAAAKACNITLSTASHRLTNLEKVFDTRFFTRDHTGLHPTQAGRVFCSHARAILLTMYSAERQLQELPPAPKR